MVARGPLQINYSLNSVSAVSWYRLSMDTKGLLEIGFAQVWDSTVSPFRGELGASGWGRVCRCFRVNFEPGRENCSGSPHGG